MTNTTISPAQPEAASPTIPLQPEPDKRRSALPPCLHIKRALESCVHGQRTAKEALVHAVTLHQRQLALMKAAQTASARLATPHLAVFGPPGTGKSALAEEAASQSGLPWLQKSLVEYSAPGFPGKQLEACVQELCDGGAISAEGGIIVLDELESCLPRAASDERSLLKQLDLASLLRGRDVRVNRGGTLQFFSSNRILWVLTAGEFAEFKRLANVTGCAIGFGGSPSVTDTHDLLSRERLLKWGMCPALTDAIGRFVVTEELTAADFLAICQMPNSPVETVRALLAESGIELDFEPQALAAMSAIARNKQCGVHGLHQVLHEIAARLMTTLPKEACHVSATAGFVLGAGPATVVETKQGRTVAPSSFLLSRDTTFKRPARSNASSASGEGRLANASDLKKWTLHP